MTDQQQAPQPEKASIGDLFGRFVEQVQGLVRAEVELAKAEAIAKAKAYGMGVALIAAAGFLGIFIFGIVLTAAILALANVMPAWAAALVVAGVLLVTAAILIGVGVSSIKKVESLTPEKIGERLKQDAQAVKDSFGQREATPEEAKPGETTPADAGPGETTPDAVTTDEVAPGETTPADAAPGETTPADTTPETTPDANSASTEGAQQ
jgi:uncharacterized membrane protein YqjE